MAAERSGYPAVTRRIPHLVILALVGLAYWLGHLDFLESRLADARFKLLDRMPSENLLLVEIDAPSLQQLPVWPWPRRFHAEVINRLIAAGAEEVIFHLPFQVLAMLGIHRTKVLLVDEHGLQRKPLLPRFLGDLLEYALTELAGIGGKVEPLGVLVELDAVMRALPTPSSMFHSTS